MKKIFSLFIAAVLMASCTPEESEFTTEYKPVLMKRSELEQSVKLLEARQIENAGKIYRYGDMLFVNELYEGVHVIDNSNPKNPNHIGFIKIIGNVDIAMKGNYIYADNAVDLVTLRYDGQEIEVVDREMDVFPEPVAPDWGSIPVEFNEENRPPNTIIVKWVKKEVNQ